MELSPQPTITTHVGAGALTRPAEQRSAATSGSGKNLRGTNRTGPRYCYINNVLDPSHPPLSKHLE